VVERILEWADAHRAAMGRWPTARAGPVLGADRESWNSIDSALQRGFRGLPGGTTLKRLLAKHRGEEAGRRRPEVTIAQILVWADAFRAAHGHWPSEASGPVDGCPNFKWNTIGTCLRQGGRGLPGGTTLHRLLVQHRGAPERRGRRMPALTVEKILAWAENHHKAHGRWPTQFSGRVADAPQESWGGIDKCLRLGRRGLPGGSSLGRLRATRPVSQRYSVCDLSLDEILARADAHHAATGQWPTLTSGPVCGEPGRDWAQIDESLRKGFHGLPGGLSLAYLLKAHGRVPCRDLTVETILAWADAHHTRTGQWPNRHSGAVDIEPGEKWLSIDQALIQGLRGLPAGLSLAKLLASRKSLGPRYSKSDT
jgi:hypothetical protein